MEGFNITIESLFKAMQFKGYKVFEDDSKPFNLNIVGIRSKDLEVNTFNDALCVFWKWKHGWNLYTMPCTTDTGLYWLNVPMTARGTAIVVPNQYRGLWQIGLHQGKYEALVQRGNIKVYRDNNKDDRLDMSDKTIEEGVFGINCHRAMDEQGANVVNKWSAGCQVLQSDHDYEVFMSIVNHAAEQWGNSFTYTLLNQSDLP
jgi:hypothetical protein